MNALAHKIRWEMEAIASRCRVCMMIKQRTGLMLIDSREVSEKLAEMLEREFEEKKKTDSPEKTS